MYRLQWSWWPEDVSLLERCPHFRGCCVQASNATLPTQELSGTKTWYSGQTKGCNTHKKV